MDDGSGRVFACRGSFTFFLHRQGGFIWPVETREEEEEEEEAADALLFGC